MSLRNTRPIRFSPAGLSDSLDATDQFPGACAILQNLIPDPSTENVWQCRPASTELTDFVVQPGKVGPPLFNTPGYVSVFKIIGSFVYGMIASQHFPGKDEPFCFDLVAGAFLPVNNVYAAVLPTSPPTTGDWTPPTMDMVGTYLIVTHPGFVGPTYFIGWFNVVNPPGPVWHAGNLYQVGAVPQNNLTFVAGGAGYIDGTYSDVPLTGGTGTGLTAQFIVQGGVVTFLYIDQFGKNYTAGDLFGVNNANLGGAGAGFQASALDVIIGGVIQFTHTPAWVRQFGQRAWFGINPPDSAQPSAIFTDVLNLSCANAGQVLTFGDNIPLVAAAPLGLSNQLGGIVESLMVFKDDSNIAQVTGDFASTNLAVNTVNVAIGTIAPRSLCSTPYGLAFLATDGFRIIDFDARVSDPIGVAGRGVTVPFMNPTFPTRVNAACDGQALRVSLQTAQGLWQEYWYDLPRKIWSGPHTFPSTMIDVFEDRFIFAPQAVQASLWQGKTVVSPSDGFTENGVVLQWIMQTAMLADNLEMAQSELAELQLKMAIGFAFPVVYVSAIDQDGQVLGFAAYNFLMAGSTWGSMVWGVDKWGARIQALRARRISFPSPVVYNRLALRYSGPSWPNLKIGDTFVRARTLGYLQEYA